MRQFIPLHSPSLFDRAEASYTKEQGVIACILSAASIEAFVNDLSDWYRIAVEHNKTCLKKRKIGICTPPYAYHELTENENLICSSIDNLEKSHSPIKLKIESIFNLLQKKLNKSDSVYQDFSTLVKVRNDLVHVKGELLKQEYPLGKNPIKGYPGYINNFCQLGIITIPKILDRNSGVLEILDNQNFAEWCIKSAYRMHLLILDELPNTPYTLQFKRDVSFRGKIIENLMNNGSK